MRGRMVFAGLTLGLITLSASGQSLNMNFGTATTPTVAPTYGAAAGQAGTWNQVTNAAASNFALVGLNGLPSGVTLTLDGGTMFFFNNTAPNGTTTAPGSNAENLLDSLWDPSGTSGIITISNLAAGPYDIYTYGVAPDSATDRTVITIGGNAQTVQGQLPNPFNESYSLGLTHALHNVNHAGGNLIINIGTGAGGFESVNGIQLVLIPTPGALALLGVAGMIGPRRRRR